MNVIEKESNLNQKSYLERISLIEMVKQERLPSLAGSLFALHRAENNQPQSQNENSLENKSAERRH